MRRRTIARRLLARNVVATALCRRVGGQPNEAPRRSEAATGY
jgi:hypothetical protein